jgi:hypothetical protein
MSDIKTAYEPLIKECKFDCSNIIIVTIIILITGLCIREIINIIKQNKCLKNKCDFLISELDTFITQTNDNVKCWVQQAKLKVIKPDINITIKEEDNTEKIISNTKEMAQKPLDLKDLKKGTFTRMAREKGYKGNIHGFAKDIMEHKDSGVLPNGKKITKLMVKRANFVVNAAKWDK